MASPFLELLFTDVWGAIGAQMPDLIDRFWFRRTCRTLYQDGELRCRLFPATRAILRGDDECPRAHYVHWLTARAGRAEALAALFEDRRKWPVYDSPEDICRVVTTARSRMTLMALPASMARLVVGDYDDFHSHQVCYDGVWSSWLTPSSFQPHIYYPGALSKEGRFRRLDTDLQHGDIIPASDMGCLRRDFYHRLRVLFAMSNAPHYKTAIWTEVRYILVELMPFLDISNNPAVFLQNAEMYISDPELREYVHKLLDTHYPNRPRAM
jgi:hypothetical protein